MRHAAAPVLDQVYGAIADPTRRAILTLLAAGDENVGGLAGRFPMSFNAVSKHVKVLERAGLVRRRVQGREHCSGSRRAAPRSVALARALPDLLGRPVGRAGGDARRRTRGGRAGRAHDRRRGPGGSGEVLVVRRVLPVERERVFAAWLDPVSLATWMRPGETTGAIVEVDPRVGGRFRILMEQPQAGCATSTRANTWPSSRRRSCRSPGSRRPPTSGPPSSPWSCTSGTAGPSWC